MFISLNIAWITVFMTLWCYFGVIWFEFVVKDLYTYNVFFGSKVNRPYAKNYLSRLWIGDDTMIRVKFVFL